MHLQEEVLSFLQSRCVGRPPQIRRQREEIDGHRRVRQQSKGNSQNAGSPRRCEGSAAVHRHKPPIHQHCPQLVTAKVCTAMLAAANGEHGRVEVTELLDSQS